MLPARRLPAAAPGCIRNGRRRPRARRLPHRLHRDPHLPPRAVLRPVLPRRRRALFAGESLASPRRVALAGACFGFAGAIKVFAIVPIVVALVLLALSPAAASSRRSSAASPRAVAVLRRCRSSSRRRSVRPRRHRVPARPLDCASDPLPRPTVRPHWPRLRVTRAQPGAERPVTPRRDGPNRARRSGILAIFLAVVARLRHPGERSLFVIFALATAAGAFTISLVPAVYYDHYAYFTAPFLALVLGLGACAAASGVRSAIGRIPSGPRRTVGRRRRSAVAALARDRRDRRRPRRLDRVAADHRGPFRGRRPGYRGTASPERLHPERRREPPRLGGSGRDLDAGMPGDRRPDRALALARSLHPPVQAGPNKGSEARRDLAVGVRRRGLRRTLRRLPLPHPVDDVTRRVLRHPLQLRCRAVRVRLPPPSTHLGGGAADAPLHVRRHRRRDAPNA